MQEAAVRGELLGDTGVIRARRAREQQEERIGWGLPGGQQLLAGIQGRQQAWTYHAEALVAGPAGMQLYVFPGYGSSRVALSNGYVVRLVPRACA